MVLLPTYVLFVNGDFLGSFQMFLGVVGIGLAAWTAVFVADYIILRGFRREQSRCFTNICCWFSFKLDLFISTIEKAKRRSEINLTY